MRGSRLGVRTPYNVLLKSPSSWRRSLGGDKGVQGLGLGGADGVEGGLVEGELRGWAALLTSSSPGTHCLVRGEEGRSEVKTRCPWSSARMTSRCLRFPVLGPTLGPHVHRHA